MKPKSISQEGSGDEVPARDTCSASGRLWLTSSILSARLRKQSKTDRGKV
jgi:hypothetical protein